MKIIVTLVLMLLAAGALVAGGYRPKSRILGQMLRNAKAPTILGMPLMNQNGEIDPNATGFRYLIDTMSYIRRKVIEQKFYEIAIADYLPMDVGEAAWASEIVQNVSFIIGGRFIEGDVDTMTGNGRIANVGAALGQNRMPTRTWAKAAEWTVMEIAQAAAASNWDVVESKISALKKNWDLGIQEIAFLGHPSVAAITGLLNDAEVNIDLALITKPISEMTAQEFAALVRGLLNAYYANSQSTVLPDTLVIPTGDYLGLATPVSEGFPNISKLEYLQNALQKMTANAGFKILPLTYAQAEHNAPISKNRYVLYRRDPNTLSMAIPVDFTMLEPGSSNRLMWQQPAYGQYSGVLINRKREVLYFDHTPVS